MLTKLLSNSSFQIFKIVVVVVVGAFIHFSGIKFIESQISSVTLMVHRSVCINLYNIKKNLSDAPSLLCQIYADTPFLGR